MQAYIMYKTYYRKEANVSKLRQREYIYVLLPKPYHQESKTNLTEFPWAVHYIVEKASQRYNLMVREVETNKRQVLHLMRLRSFAPRQPIIG